MGIVENYDICIPFSWIVTKHTNMVYDIYIYILYNYMCILYDIYKDRMFNQYNTVIDHIAVEESPIHGEVS